MRLRIEEDAGEDVWGLLIDIEVHESNVPTVRNIAKKHLKKTAKEYHDGALVGTVSPSATKSIKMREKVRKDENLLRSA